MSDWTYTNWYATRLHAFGEHHPQGPVSVGRYDTALCGCVVEPLSVVSDRRARYGAKTKPAEKLPRCKLCARKADADA